MSRLGLPAPWKQLVCARVGGVWGSTNRRAFASPGFLVTVRRIHQSALGTVVLSLWPSVTLPPGALLPE